MAKKRSANFTFLLTIFITVFIDLLGIGIIIPVIPAVFFEEGSKFFTGEYSKDTIKVFYTLLLACYPFMQLFGAPMLGALSDKFGRKPILIIALIGTLIGYMLFAYAIVTQNLWLLFFSRMLPGFTGGNISIITSSIADVSDADSRTRNFGLVGMAFGIGFILGPMIGGLLSDNTIVSWFDHHVPFIFTAGLTLLNICLVIWKFKETLPERQNTKVSAFKGFQNIISSFANAQLRSVFIIVLLISIGFTFYTQFFSVLLYEAFDFKEKDIGFLYGYVGIWLAITQGVIVRWLSYRLPPKKILIFSVPLLALGISLIFIPSEGWMFYIVNPVIAIFYGITSPNLTSLVSSQADKTLQGAILGINQSMLALGQTITPLIGGFLLIRNVYLPIAASAIFIFIAFLIFYVFLRLTNVITMKSYSFYLFLFALLFASCKQTNETKNKNLDTGFLKSISIEEAAEKISKGDAVFIDVRTPQEVAGGRIPGSVHIDVSSADFEKKLATLDKNKEYVVYCKKGGRSTNACKKMHEMGFRKLNNMTAGYSGWNK